MAERYTDVMFFDHTKDKNLDDVNYSFVVPREHIRDIKLHDELVGKNGVALYYTNGSIISSLNMESRMDFFGLFAENKVLPLSGLITNSKIELKVDRQAAKIVDEILARGEDVFSFDSYYDDKFIYHTIFLPVQIKNQQYTPKIKDAQGNIIPNKNNILIFSDGFHTIKYLG